MVARLFAPDDARLMREGCANASFGTSVAGTQCGMGTFLGARVRPRAIKSR